MLTNQPLQHLLLDLDRRSYKAYKQIQGRYQFREFTLSIDYVQGDPFASPSKLRIFIPQTVAKFPQELYQNPSREIALRDYITRQFDRISHQLSERRGTGKSGLIKICSIGQEVLERTTVFINHQQLEVRFFVGLPASGRSILGNEAVEMLCEDIPTIVSKSLKFSALNQLECRHHIETIEDADYLREQLPQKGLIAFIADGSILPRRSGVDQRPLLKEAIPFQAPESLKVTLNCPNRGKITGMGIPPGITLIVGGGYHGKSTLLRAIELGIYNHIPGDGREFVITHPTAVKIRAEEGRSVVGVDISPFINQLPFQKSTTQFSTENASGSTSQAANIMEALEAGLSSANSTDFPKLSPILLVDEDTSATNFMIRDQRMQTLIKKEKEPITPFLDKVRQLYEDYQVSTLLVMGGSGDYFEVADTVIAMDNFHPFNVTEKAKEIALSYQNHRQPEGGTNFGKIRSRIPLPESLDPSRGHRDVKVKVRDIDTVTFGTEEIDLSAISQLVENAQLRAILAAMIYAKTKYMNHQLTLSQILDHVMADLTNQGIDILSPFPEADFAMFRRFELAAAINRLRSLSVSMISK